MDFNLKQWKEHQHEHEYKHESESVEQQQNKCAKITKHMFLETPNHHQQQQQVEVAALPLFVSSTQPNNITATTPTAIPTFTPKFPRVGERYSFSTAQWQELELQALIYRHMVAGASVPPELLQLVKKSLYTCSTPPFYSYHHHYSPHFQPHVDATAWYWGKGAMDPEPGRCRRTDGKKWRCSRDVVADHKYCERHMHRGRNRSRKPVEFPAATSTSAADALVSSLNKSSPTISFASGTSSADTQFSLSRISRSGTSPLDAFQLNPETSDKKTLLGPQLESSSATNYGDNSKNNNRVLMHFFDDYPRSGDTNGNMASSTSLSMSTPGNSSLDFLRLSTGNGDEVGLRGGRNGNGNDDGERSQHVSWNAGGWGANPVGSMGGPLAEALRSSSNSSPTSVLHQLPRCSAPDTSFISF